MSENPTTTITELVAADLAARAHEERLSDLLEEAIEQRAHSDEALAAAVLKEPTALRALNEEQIRAVLGVRAAAETVVTELLVAGGIPAERLEAVCDFDDIEVVLKPASPSGATAREDDRVWLIGDDAGDVAAMTWMAGQALGVLVDSDDPNESDDSAKSAASTAASTVATIVVEVAEPERTGASIRAAIDTAADLVRALERGLAESPGLDAHVVLEGSGGWLWRNGSTWTLTDAEDCEWTLPSAEQAIRELPRLFQHQLEELSELEDDELRPDADRG